MAIKPILFNTEMVRAILDGRKSCTRRVIKPQPDEKHTYPLGFVTDSTEKKEVGCFGFGIDEYGGSIKYVKPPYQPGDILYVRETWEHFECHCCEGDEHGNCYKEPQQSVLNKSYGCYMYRATDEIYGDARWQPSIHMPKEAARIWLKVTDVKVERLQNITEDGSKAEGAIDNRGFIHSPDNEYDRIHTAREHFIEIWNSTIKKSDFERCSWDANPWVWVIEFERCEKPEV
nr:MAG TPA: ASCH domain protein [Caudoviricetes sp.]